MSTRGQAGDQVASGKPITGRKVLVMMIVGFGIIIAANMTMMFAATGTFPGLVVENSYVASQEWDRKTAAQRALGWSAAADYAEGTLTVRMTGRDGAPVAGLRVTATVGRPATTRDDMTLELAERQGAYAAPVELGPGRWRIALQVAAESGAPFEADAEFTVPGGQ
jgi:nitrogen fixation protein FixH